MSVSETQPFVFDVEKTKEWQALSYEPEAHTVPKERSGKGVFLLVTLSILVTGTAVGMAFGWAQANDQLRDQRTKVQILEPRVVRLEEELRVASEQRDVAVADATISDRAANESQVALNQAQNEAKVAADRVVEAQGQAAAAQAAADAAIAEAAASSPLIAPVPSVEQVTDFLRGRGRDR